MNALARHLFRTAGECFGRAMQSYAAEEHLHFYLEGGIALEHALKARLASEHATLIAEPKHFESILVLAQLAQDKLPPPVLRTISVTESLGRCRLLCPQIGSFASGVTRVIAY